MQNPSEKPAPHDRQDSAEKASSVAGLRFPRQPRKRVLLPAIHDLVLEGYTCREIGERLGLGKSTVNRWLKELKRERRSVLADSADLVVSAVARYEAIYREAMHAWRQSKADKFTRLVEESVPGGCSGVTQKSSTRTEARTGEVAFLAQARAAADAICKLIGLQGRKNLAPDCGPSPASAGQPRRSANGDGGELPDETKGQLVPLEAQLKARNGAMADWAHRPGGFKLPEHEDKPGQSGKNGDNGGGNWHKNGTN